MTKYTKTIKSKFKELGKNLEIIAVDSKAHDATDSDWL